jgi:hypothetical protein
MSARVGDPFSWANITTSWVMCRDNVDCCFEGYVEVEWLTTTEREWICPRCQLLQTDEVD